MSTRHYALPVGETGWRTPMGGKAALTWDYDEGRDRLLSLYEKGKNLQWNARERIDWSHAVDRDDPFKAPPQYHPLHGSAIWDRLGEPARNRVRLHTAAWQTSQFLHGEQGALLCAAKIVNTVPDLDAKYYAATQVIDEARHVEVFARYLNEKLELVYPINPHLKTLLEQILGDERWDLTYLGMQVLIEGLALAAFGTIRDLATDPLARTINAYVMQDESRHVAFGRLALRDYYPQLTEKERDEREEFCVEACHLMRDRFLGEEMWRNLELGEEAVQHVKSCELMREFRRMLFSRIVPTLKDIGLWGRRVQRAFGEMGVLDYAELDLDSLAAIDEQIAEQLDVERLRTAAGED